MLWGILPEMELLQSENSSSSVSPPMVWGSSPIQFPHRDTILGIQPGLTGYLVEAQEQPMQVSQCRDGRGDALGQVV